MAAGQTQYSEGDKARAAKLHIYGGKSYAELTQVEGLPDSKGTFSTWATQGAGTQGTPWKEVRDLIEQERKTEMEKRSIEEELGTMNEVAERAGPLLVEAAESLRSQLIEEGDANPTWTKYGNLIDKIGDFARQKHVSEVQERLEHLAEKIGSILGREIGDDTVARRVQTAVQQEFNQAYTDIDELLGIDK